MAGIPRSSGEDLCYQMMQVRTFQIAGLIFLRRSDGPSLLERAACMTALDCTEWGACMHIYLHKVNFLLWFIWESCDENRIFCLNIIINSMAVAKLYKAEYQTGKPLQIDLIWKFSNLNFLLLAILHDDYHGTPLYGSS